MKIRPRPHRNLGCGRTLEDTRTLQCLLRSWMRSERSRKWHTGGQSPSRSPVIRGFSPIQEPFRSGRGSERGSCGCQESSQKYLFTPSSIFRLRILSSYERSWVSSSLGRLRDSHSFPILNINFGVGQICPTTVHFLSKKCPSGRMWTL